MRFAAAAIFLAFAHAWTPAAAQQPGEGSRTDAVRVFLDCPSCDMNYMRTEVTFVNYVRDRVGADVHVLVTTEPTGSGGTEYTLQFIGLDAFKGIDQTLTHSASQTATADERRRGVAAAFKLGLVRYVAATPLASRLKITFDEPEKQSQARAVSDPWNYWVFRIGASGDFEGEQSREERGLSGSFSANRTTERWKVNISGSAEYDLERFDLEEEEGDGTFTAITRQSDVSALVTRSLGEHWAFGGTAAVQASTFQNYDLRTRIGPGIEYDVFPYSESTRRLLTFFYTMGVQTADYTEETIYGKTSEQLLDHQFEVALALRQPWGTASASFETQHYLNRSGKYRIDAFGEIDVRLFKGFSLELFGGASRRRDQLSLRRGSATTEEILVRQRELATGYEYEVSFGVSYSFGSIFNNVVNPRFRNVGGF